MKVAKIDTTQIYMDDNENWRQPIKTTQKCLLFGQVQYYDKESIKGDNQPSTCSVLEFLIWAKTTVAEKIAKLKANTQRIQKIIQPN